MSVMELFNLLVAPDFIQLVGRIRDFLTFGNDSEVNHEEIREEELGPVLFARHQALMCRQTSVWSSG